MERFWMNVDKSDPSSCWVWTGHLTTAGYGRITVAGKKVFAHRLSLELAGVALVDGLVVDHLCRNRACVNPAHMEQVTLAENTRRGDSANRKKTQCVHGHPFDDTNTYVRPDGKRACRTCMRDTMRVRNGTRWQPPWARYPSGGPPPGWTAVH